MANPPNPPDLPPRRDHKITLEQARALVARRPQGLTTRGGHFPREVFDRILAQPGCAGIRFYYGTNPDGSPAIVLVGIDANNADMTAGEIDDTHFPCPPFCDTDSALR
jgi:hypothetical protein